MVVGAADELDKMPLLLGDETDERMDVNANVLSVDVEVVEASLAGKKLAELQGLGALHRGDHPHPPPGAGDDPNRQHDPGDGRQHSRGGRKERRGCLCQAGAGFTAPGRARPTCCLSWPGCCWASCWAPSRSTCPMGSPCSWAAPAGRSWSACWWGISAGLGRCACTCRRPPRTCSRELGLMLFLAGAGIAAGANFVEVLQGQGLLLLAGGALITIAVDAGRAAADVPLLPHEPAGHDGLALPPA